MKNNNNNRVEGIIYKVLPYRETSKLLYLYTKYGKLSFIATASQTIKSSSRTYTQYLTQLRFDRPNNLNKLNRLINTEVVNDFASIKQTYQYTKKAGALLELINSCVFEDENHLKIYEQLMLALKRIESRTSYLVFSLRLLIILGYHFSFPKEKGVPLGYSISENKLVYENSNYDLTFKETEAMLQLIISREDEKINLSDEVISKLTNFVKLYYNYHLQIDLKLIEV